MGVEDTNMKEYKLKPMKCEFNYLSKSDGSAILSQGNTVALVSVNGPLDIKMQSQSIEKTTLEVLFTSKSGKPSVADRYKENAIRQTCETALLGCLYPRTGITITVQELEDYGGLIACSVNCVCLALLNSGIAMRSVFAAVSCAITDVGNIVLDPTPEQVAAAHAQLSFVFDGRDRSLITAFTEGTFSTAAYNEALERCRAGSELVLAFYRDIVGKYSAVIS
ncbi:exosome complex component RRP46-like [Pectinophora gossypiella]|uniref:exosome complex component RRP46-like n=1 Tax=Pectinophora gossypiella TaxID=13191 RepID=UPI00214E0C13|nr:exosome complex component RRP46-like [Pectinophora gossypiella]XP_049878226.1 exosome complex component RRP46-like [Pectinophora gossypiella]